MWRKTNRGAGCRGPRFRFIKFSFFDVLFIFGETEIRGVSPRQQRDAPGNGRTKHGVPLFGICRSNFNKGLNKDFAWFSQVFGQNPY